MTGARTRPARIALAVTLAAIGWTFATATTADAHRGPSIVQADTSPGCNLRAQLDLTRHGDLRSVKVRQKGAVSLNVAVNTATTVPHFDFIEGWRYKFPLRGVDGDGLPLTSLVVRAAVPNPGFEGPRTCAVHFDLTALTR